MKIEKAVRKAIPFIGCFYGKSGSGKTYSALKLAQGLLDTESKKNKICVIDTENGRASHYADEFNFDVINLDPPFNPSRYLEAIKLAEKENYQVLVIDSISHEWEGIGGCLELAEEGRTASGKILQGLNKWAKVKMEHRKLMQYLLQAKIHIIFCARAKELLEQNGTSIVYKGIIPIQEKNFSFEMLTTFFMENSGKVKLEKCQRSLASNLQLKENEFISEKHGKIILDWINKGEKVNFREKELKNEATEIAMSGNLEDLKKWFLSLNKEDQIIAKSFSEDVKKTCEEYNKKIQEDNLIDKTTGQDISSLLSKNNETLELPPQAVSKVEVKQNIDDLL